jgi:hypothetical protein
MGNFIDKKWWIRDSANENGRSTDVDWGKALSQALKSKDEEQSILEHLESWNCQLGFLFLDSTN